MSDIHITRELLRAVARGELSERALAQIQADHLESLCPFCRREIRAWLDEQASTPGPAFLLQTLPAVFDRHAPELEARLREAERDFEDLLARPREERLSRIDRARSRFRGPFLAERLIQESRRRTLADPGEALHLAELARAVLHRSPASPESANLAALATAALGNACRAAGDLRRAEEHFRHVRYLILHEGVTAARVLGEIDHLEGSLRKDQRRFREAEALLTRAAMLFRISGDSSGTAKVLVKIGELYFHQRHLDRAIEMVQVALERLSPDDEPRLYLNGRHNLALYLAEAGRYEQAAGLVAADTDLYRRFPEPWTQLRLTWLRGKIAAGLGEAREAERLFRETRDGFLGRGIGYDAAMVSLDLALLYHKEGRTAEVQRLSEEMVAAFETQEVHREALAALRLFQDAARREEVTDSLIRDLATFLASAKNNPELRFR
jgi:tetratricopeptide (TPR) repeat protein